MALDKAWHAYQAKERRATNRLGVALHRFVMPALLRRFDTATAEDLAQETVLVVFSELDAFEYRGARSLKAWVRQIALNRVFGHLRRQSRHARIVAECARELARVEVGPGEHTHWRERLALVEDLLTTIQPRFVEALLHLAQGRDPAELARAEGVTNHTIHSRAHRGLVRLRGELRTRHHSPSGFLATPRW